MTRTKKIEDIRELLNVPKDQRIAQYIYNQFRHLEIKEGESRGVDIFYVKDEDFIHQIIGDGS